MDPSQFPDVEINTREIDRSLASHPLVASSVKFTGSVLYDEIQKLYEEHDIFVFPSLAESFGHPLVEAMASGLPIIASDIPVCREICEDAAVYFSPLDPKDLADNIIMLKNNPELCTQLSQIGRKRAETHFNLEDHVRRLSGIVGKVATNEQG
jgi:glycosyltransferase involved in cell wall biosynthesis